jgi:hypothetical protein
VNTLALAATPHTGNEHPFPPRLPRAAMARTPSRHLRDTLQEAWVGFLSGRSARTAARAYLARELLHERREPALSQLTLGARPGEHR